MASWHKRARLGVAVFGLAVAGLVYFAMGERRQQAPLQAPKRMDPKAIFEATAGFLERVAGTDKAFNLEFARVQSYADGSQRFFDVRITVPRGENRTFKVTAAEAFSGKDEVELQLTGSVRLEDSDGFFLTTERATYNQQTLVARAPDAVAFGKGRMSGSGRDVAYDQELDVLTVAADAQVTTVDEAGTPVMQFASGTATLDRMQHVLTLDRAVHVLRGEQTIDADHGVARLGGNDDIVTFVELRGNARVAGGGASIDSMSARDIDLDYTDDGQRLERVHLAGTAAIAMSGEGESAGRQLVGETVDLELAEDGSLTRAVGDGDVRLDLPASGSAPGRSIQAQKLDGKGEAGKGLTTATFTGDVVFSEAAARGDAKTGTRTARAQKLETGLANDAVTTATFTVDATFEEPGLKACAGRMDYQPDKGSLALSSATAGGGPIVAEEQVAIEAQEIGITLETRRMVAKGGVTTRMRAPGRCRPAQSRPAAERGASRMPGLLDENGQATITAAALDYDGDSGRAVYTGRAALWQGETSIHSDSLTLEQASGNLRAVGNVTSKIRMDGTDSLGQSQELAYDDKTRRVSYASPPPPPPVPGTPPAPAAGGPVPPARSRVQGPIGDLHANWIDIVLAPEGGKIERISARSNVRVVQGSRDVTGGSTFTYDPAQEEYTISGTGTGPVRLVDRQGAKCTEYSGRSLTFYKSSDRIVVDGKNLINTEIEPLVCPAPAR